MQKLDEFVNVFSKKMCLVKNRNENEFQKLISMLMKRRLFAIDQDLWKELYLQNRNFVTDIGKIPTTFVLKHNEILSFYMRQKIPDVTFLRFDTHSDLNEIKNSALLPTFYEKYLKTGNTKYIDKAQELVWDIGASKSGVLMTTGIKNVVWCMPSWVPDKQIEINYCIKSNKRNLKLSTDSVINDIDFSYSKNISGIKKYTKVQTGKLTLTGFEKIVKMLSREYILDVDLDYFVCNGERFDKSYFKIPFDLKSANRTEFVDFNQNIPRNRNFESDELLKYENSLQKEIEKIDQRIHFFLKLISALKKLGFKPYLISVCDSSNINSVSNGYVPTNLALYVHVKVVNGLKKIFG